MERDLRDQRDRASTVDSNSGAGAEWKRRFESLESDHEELKMELREQQQVMTQALHPSYLSTFADQMDYMPAFGEQLFLGTKFHHYLYKKLLIYFVGVGYGRSQKGGFRFPQRDEGSN